MPSRPTLMRTTQITLTPGVVSTSIPGEVVILDPAGDSYFSLQGAGQTVWEILQSGPSTVADLTAAIVDAYEVDGATAERDLLALLDDLLARGLVAIADAGRP